MECGAGIWVRPLLYAPEGVVHSFVNSDRNVEFGKGTLAAYRLTRQLFVTVKPGMLDKTFEYM